MTFKEQIDLQKYTSSSNAGGKKVHLCSLLERIATGGLILGLSCVSVLVEQPCDELYSLTFIHGAIPY